jgi:FkbM family methyltransferase
MLCLFSPPNFGMRLKWLLVAYVLFNVFYATAFFVHPPLGAWALAASGRGPEGLGSQGLDAYTRRFSQHEIERRILAQSRFVLRDASGLQLMETPKGKFWEPATEGTAIVAQLAEQEAKYTGFERPIHPGDIVLDCGANVGSFTRLAVDQGAAIVVAVEPAPENVACLRRTFAAEIAAGKVIVYPKGVWDKDDFLTLSVSNTTSAMDSFVIQTDTHTGVTVPLTTIDKLVLELKLPRVDFIKMDIEGAEQRALAGGANAIGAWRPRMEISVNHLPEDPRMVPLVIRRIQPDYRIECLESEVHRKDLRLEAEILYFH